MRRRAESQQQTRRRITESAVALHGTLGPSRTSMSAVAAHAGVRRSTLYRHFADEAALFDACSAHWSAANPPPDIEAWGLITDPNERLLAALQELYAYYGDTEGMFENVLRDEPTMSLVREHLAGFRGYLEQARETLMAGRGVRGAARRRTQAALGHALAFSTWKSLTREEDASVADAIALMCDLAATATSAPAHSAVRTSASRPRSARARSRSQ
jgi:AcrR family transcriptional regulator